MIRIATVFSGIGAAEQALQQLGLEHEIVFACDNGERYLDIEVDDIKKEIKKAKGKEMNCPNLYGQHKKHPLWC